MGLNRERFYKDTVMAGHHRSPIHNNEKVTLSLMPDHFR